MPRLEEDIAAAVEVFGAENVGLIWGLGTYRWPDAATRDAFLDAVKVAGVDPIGS